jgi:hypothetical protein
VQHSAKTSTRDVWAFPLAEFLEKLGLPPDTPVIQVHVSFLDSTVQIVGAARTE